MDQIKVTQQEIDALLARVESGNLQNGDCTIIKSMANAITILSQAVNDKAVSIKRLLAMLFGSKTEKKNAVLKESSQDKNSSSKPDSSQKKKKKGHGRRSASNYTGADRKAIAHEKLNHKDPCPLCPKGKLYRLRDPGFVVCLNGQAPLNATV